MLNKYIVLYCKLLSRDLVEKHDPRFGYSVISEYSHIVYTCTVKPVLSGHSKIDKTKILMANGSLMKVESIAECYF